MAGWLYILSNPVMNGLLKIGYTERDPFERAKEISNDTGVPSDFVVDYQIYISNPRKLEYKVHQLLHKYRFNKNREFFTCSHEIAISAIKRAILELELDNEFSAAEIYHKLDKEIIEKRIEENNKLDKIKKQYLEITSIKQSLEDDINREKEINERLEKRKTHLLESNNKLKVENKKIELDFYEKKKSLLLLELDKQHKRYCDLYGKHECLISSNLKTQEEIREMRREFIDFLYYLLQSLEQKLEDLKYQRDLYKGLSKEEIKELEINKSLKSSISSLKNEYAIQKKIKDLDNIEHDGFQRLEIENRQERKKLILSIIYIPIATFVVSGLIVLFLSFFIPSEYSVTINRVIVIIVFLFFIMGVYVSLKEQSKELERRKKNILDSINTQREYLKKQIKQQRDKT